MTVLDVLNELDETGKLQLYVKAKIIRDKYYFYREVATKVNHMISTGTPKLQAYTNFSETYGVSEDTIRLACRKMNATV